MKILVTGASGNVGRQVVWELEKGHELRLFSRSKPSYETKHPHIAGDLRDREILKQAVKGMEAVAHLGANPWFGPETFEINVMGTYYLAEACRELGVKRIVMAGSDWGVAKSDEKVSLPDFLPVDETHPCRPNDEYGLSKVVDEQILEMYARVHGIRSAVLRMTSVWDPQGTDGYAKADKSEALDGAAKYWWTYVDARDVARAFRLALESASLPLFGVYFLTAEDSTLDISTAEALKKYMPTVPQRGSFAGHESLLSGAAAARAFGFKPEHGWRAN
jgi:nucleoside-diphosphate-sugar epimerase